MQPVSDAGEIAALVPMPQLLERAGFRIRSATRADCARCTGGSRGTVSFTPELAHCFRCDWRANNLGLAREMGLLPGDAATRARLRDAARRRARFDGEIQHFEEWRDVQIRRVSDERLALSRAAVRASYVLQRHPNCEPAWDALARYCHSEARLSAAFDFLTFAKASPWLENDATALEVFEAWRNRRAA